MMKHENQDFQIVPIFNPSISGVWSEFLDIEIACDTQTYEIDPPCKSVRRNILRRYKNNLHEYKHNFAFAAYQGTKIIGFSYGYIIDRDESYLHRLYVLPQYHKLGIGTQLLRAAEQSCAIFSNTISLIALSKAVDFYEQKHGYSKFGGDMEKELTVPVNTIVPVFQWVKKDFNLKIACPTDTMALKQSKFQPIFVHVNGDSKIDAVATRMPNGVTKLWPTTNKLSMDSIKLLNALDKVK